MNEQRARKVAGAVRNKHNLGAAERQLTSELRVLDVATDLDAVEDISSQPTTVRLNIFSSQ
jgi:hypothetical protein